MKKKIHDCFSRLIISACALLIARKIAKGKMTINDVPEKFREIVLEAIKMRENEK